MSLTEDRYGAVQRDIPRILEALLAFLTALEDAQREIAPSDDAEDTARAVDLYSRPADGTWLVPFIERSLPLMDRCQQ